MDNSPLHYVFDLLTELRARIPPKEGCRHNITLTYDERLELTVMGEVQRVFWLTPDEDGHLSPTEIVDFIETTLKELTQEE